jgi:hypothetical protein
LKQAATADSNGADRVSVGDPSPDESALAADCFVSSVHAVARVVDPPEYHHRDDRNYLAHTTPRREISRNEDDRDLKQGQGPQNPAARAHLRAGPACSQRDLRDMCAI